jgi:hypothetical protein
LFFASNKVAVNNNNNKYNECGTKKCKKNTVNNWNHSMVTKGLQKNPEVFSRKLLIDSTQQ